MDKTAGVIARFKRATDAVDNPIASWVVMLIVRLLYALYLVLRIPMDVLHCLWKVIRYGK